MFKDSIHSAVFQQSDSGFEGYKLAHSAHIDSIAVEVSHLGRRADNDDPTRMEAVKHRQDRLFQSGSADNRIVDDNERVYPVLNTTVCHVVDMCGQIVPRSSLGDKGPQFDILEGNLFDSKSAVKNLGNFLSRKFSVS